jgi:8-oxo-dGTP pyrophosphatase MutT (NUDIX family)
MISTLRDLLALYEPRRIQCSQTRAAGVIIPVFENNGEASIVLTKRACSVAIHKGEVSFPGGMYEEQDGNTKNTALRECCEEFGVRTGDVEVIGRLDELYTLTGFVISPYVGIIPYPYTFRTTPAEVAYLIMLPFNYLLTVKPHFEAASYEGKTLEVPSFHYAGDRIWGATCRILLRLREIIDGQKV